MMHLALSSGKIPTFHFRHSCSCQPALARYEAATAGGTVLSVAAPDLDLMMESINLPAAPSEPLTSFSSVVHLLTPPPHLCVQLDGASPALEERLQEEHRQPVPLRVHAAEPAP